MGIPRAGQACLRQDCLLAPLGVSAVRIHLKEEEGEILQSYSHDSCTKEINFPASNWAPPFNTVQGRTTFFHRHRMSVDLIMLLILSHVSCKQNNNNKQTNKTQKQKRDDNNRQNKDRNKNNNSYITYFRLTLIVLIWQNTVKKKTK